MMPHPRRCLLHPAIVKWQKVIQRPAARLGEGRQQAAHPFGPILVAGCRPGGTLQYGRWPPAPGYAAQLVPGPLVVGLPAGDGGELAGAVRARDGAAVCPLPLLAAGVAAVLPVAA